jgi:methylmalonyl-CoA/ethylmalonyl-CoA epimerase
MVDRSAFGPGATFHHVGLAVRSIEAVAPDLEVWEDPIQKVRVAFLTLDGAPIELVEPASEDSPVTRSLQAGAKLLHLCFEVDGIEEAASVGKGWGFRLIAAPVPAAAFGGRRIAWLFSAEWGLVELLER